VTREIRTVPRRTGAHRPESSRGEARLLSEQDRWAPAGTTFARFTGDGASVPSSPRPEDARRFRPRNNARGGDSRGKRCETAGATAAAQSRLPRSPPLGTFPGDLTPSRPVESREGRGGSGNPPGGKIALESGPPPLFPFSGAGRNRPSQRRPRW